MRANRLSVGSYLASGGKGRGIALCGSFCSLRAGSFAVGPLCRGFIVGSLTRFERWFGAWCVAVVLCVSCAPAHASGSVASATAWQCSGYQSYIGYGSTSDAACRSASDQWAAANTGGTTAHNYSGTYTLGAPGACSGTNPINCSFPNVTYTTQDTYQGYPPTTTTFHPALTASGAPACPPNSTNAAGLCTCNASYSPNFNATSCQAGSCAAGQSVSNGVYSSKDPSGGVMGANSSGCTSGGCASVFQGFTPTGSSLISGQRYYWYTGTYSTTGSACNAAAASAPPAPIASTPNAMAPDSCAAGQAMGQVNSKNFCYYVANGKPVDAPTASTTTTVSAPVAGASGASSQTTTTTVTNPDGTATTTATTKTTNADGSSTTTTTTTGSGLTNPGGTGYANLISGQSSAPATGGGGGGGASGGCADNPSASGCGGVAHGVAAEYTEKSRTFAQVMADRQTQWNSAPVIASASTFFAVTSSGSCPTYSLPIAFFSRTFTIDQFCSTMATNMFVFVKAAVLLMCGFLAFKTAFL